MMNKAILVLTLSAGLMLTPVVWAGLDPWAESYRLEALTQYEAAVKALEPVLKKNSKHEFAVLRRGWLNYLRGAHNESLRDYQLALDLNPQSLDARLGLMLPLIMQQRWREVASHANKVLEVAPWNYYAHVRLMISEEGERKWDTLAKHAARVSRRYPSDVTVLIYQARANDWLKNDGEARRAYEKVLEHIPNHLEALQYLNRVQR
jgi:tetratricopeptide (TPR) repeat protein